MYKLNLPSILFFLVFSFPLFGQSNVLIDNTISVEDMIMDFFDDSTMVISNITTTGDGASIGFFDAADSNFGLDAGIVFSTGNVLDAVGPNNVANRSTQLFVPGDLDIETLVQNGGTVNSFDAVAIEFDFTVPQSDSLHFNYVFASEEYPEYVNTPFNDAFGFFITGPNINGIYTLGADNISVVPNTSLPAAINNINHLTNSQYYIDNIAGQELQYDGYTVTLPASFYALANETYHIKMVVSDVYDAIYDSAVFLSFNSLGQDTLLPPVPLFEAEVDASAVDFINKSRYARTYSWKFGNGESSQLRHPATVIYDETGDYDVYLTATSFCCKETYMSSITIDSIAIITANIATTNNPLACYGDTNASIDLELVGAELPLVSLEWQPNIPDLNNVGAGVYQYTAIDQAGITFDGSITISQPEPLTVTTNTIAALNGIANGSATINPSGGTPPYSIEWSNGMSGPRAEAISSGEYEIIITDASGCNIQTTVLIDSATGLLENNDFHFNLFPNPVKNQIQLEWKEISNLKEIKIYDVLGNSIPFQFNQSTNNVTILFNSSVAVGIYFIRIELEDGRQAISRFMKK